MMESCPKSNILELHPDTVTTVRRSVNLDKPGAMKEAVRILNEWVKQQVHFKKKDFPPEYLETTIITCKGSVERAKAILDKVCTARTLFPEAFKPFNMREEYESLMRGKVYELAIPKMTEDNMRLLVVKVNKFKPDLLDCIYKWSYACVDYVRMKDYHSGVVIIYELYGDLKDVMTDNIILDFKKCYSVLVDTFAVRIKRIHVITSSKLIEPLLMMVKPFLKKKIVDRIVLHKSVEELSQYYPKEILPKDYGGYEKSLEELQEIFLDEMTTDESLEFMKTTYEMRTDESLRAEGSFNELYAGMAGTFRALSVD